MKKSRIFLQDIKKHDKPYGSWTKKKSFFLKQFFYMKNVAEGIISTSIKGVSSMRYCILDSWMIHIQCDMHYRVS